MQIFGLTIEGHGHNILVQSVPVEQEQTGLDSLSTVIAISWGSTAAPPSSWDRCSSDKPHIGNAQECIIFLYKISKLSQWQGKGDIGQQV